MKINMDFADIEVAVDNLEGAADAIRAGCMKGIANGLELVLGDATGLVPVDTGRLWGSLESRAEPTANGATGSVSANTEYALFVEMGTGAAGAASGGNDKAPGATYTMDHPGMEAQPFLYPAYKANQDNIVSCVDDAIGEALGR